MSFRSRLLTALLVVVLAPLTALAVLIPREMAQRFSSQYRTRAATLAGMIDRRLATDADEIDTRLAHVARRLRADNAIRSAIVSPGGDRGLLLEFAGHEALSANLSMLQIQNDSGRILSSAHFQNEFDRLQPALPAVLLRARDERMLVSVRTASGSMLVLARTDTVSIGPRRLTLVGGIPIHDDYLRALVPSAELSATIAVADSVLARSGPPNSAGMIATDVEAIDSIPLMFVDATGDGASARTARMTIAHSTAELDRLLADVRMWIVGVIVGAIALALVVALWMSGRLSRPLAQLANETAHVNLDRPRARFASASRNDEVGALARRLTEMVERLASSAGQLRDAERRATLGDVARQINHDIKNGLTPIRNVVRHLAQVAREKPAELAPVFTERQKTLESSVEYLDSLARNYARLSPRLDVAPCAVAPVIDEVVRGATARGGGVVRSIVPPDLPPLAADAAVLRRILENVVGNAIDAIDGTGGEVVVTAELVGGDRPVPMLRLAVTDTGRGMTDEELTKAFDDFYTTKPGGTGLGLSVVRRLVADLSGILRVETEPGRGTQVTVDLPVGSGAPGAPPAGEPGSRTTPVVAPWR